MVCALGGLGVPAAAAASKPPASVDARSDPFTLSDLLPTPWSKNPRLFFMVVTEMSEEGRKRPAVTPEQPVYFQLRNSGYTEIGDSGAGEKTLKAEQIEPLLLKALAKSGYLPVSPGQAPSLFITYRWGLHSNLNPDFVAINKAAGIRNQIDRAVMIGGEKFGRELAQAYREAAASAPLVFSFRPPDPNALEPVMPPPHPVSLLRMRDFKIGLMVDRSETDIYFVVASAYDYVSTIERRPVHLWRTRITVPTAGVTQEQTLPALIASGGPFFGKETDMAQSVARRVQEGSVQIGPAKVVEPRAPPPPAPAAPAK